MITRTVREEVCIATFDRFIKDKVVKLIVLNEDFRTRGHIAFLEYGTGTDVDLEPYELPTTGSYVSGGILVTGLKVEGSSICSDEIRLLNTPLTPNKFKMGGYAIISGGEVIMYDLFKDVRVVQDVDLIFMPNPSDGKHVIIELDVK